MFVKIIQNATDFYSRSYLCRYHNMQYFSPSDETKFSDAREFCRNLIMRSSPSDSHVNGKAPFHFQDNGIFAVRLCPADRQSTLSRDGTGSWRMKGSWTTGPICTRSYINVADGAANFKKNTFFLEDESTKTIHKRLAVVYYFWEKGTAKTPIDCAPNKRPRRCTSLLLPSSDSTEFLNRLLRGKKYRSGISSYSTAVENFLLTRVMIPAKKTIDYPNCTMAIKKWIEIFIINKIKSRYPIRYVSAVLS